MSQTIVSASPHTHADTTSRRIMYDVLIALIPAFLVSVYLFGIGALVVTGVAVASCIFVEYIIQKYLLKTETSISDGSAIITMYEAPNSSTIPATASRRHA